MGIEVLSYRDDANVVLNEEGNDWSIGEVVLHPKVQFGPAIEVSANSALAKALA